MIRFKLLKVYLGTTDRSYYEEDYYDCPTRIKLSEGSELLELPEEEFKQLVVNVGAVNEKVKYGHPFYLVVKEMTQEDYLMDAAAEIQLIKEEAEEIENRKAAEAVKRQQALIKKKEKEQENLYKQLEKIQAKIGAKQNEN